jgi:subtilisin family serine protease
LKTFKSDVFSGLSVETDTDNIDTLQDYFAIAKAWPMNQIWLAPLEPSSVFDSDTAAKNYSVHAWTGVDKLHDAGIYGKGATVAIVDTGIDYNHPAVSNQNFERQLIY